MYTIKNSGRVLFDPSLDGHYIESPSMALSANNIGTLTFTVYRDNPEFSSLPVYTADLAVYDGADVVARFRPVTPKVNFSGGVSYMCEERIGQMDDVLRRPSSFTGTVTQYIKAVVAEYNGRVASDRRVTVGKILFQPSLSSTFENEDYEGYWETLQTHLVAEHGGYLVPRYTADKVYLDYLSESDLPASPQAIAFASNMADMFLESDAADLYTVLVPVGPSELDGDTRKSMTVESVNGGKDYIENTKGITKYGRREKVQTWNSAESPKDLLNKAKAYFSTDAARLKETLSLSAADLSMAGVNVAALKFMTRVRVVSVPHGIDVTYPLTKITIPLGDPDLIRIELGQAKEQFSDRVAKNSVSRRRSGGGGGRAAGSSEMEHWEMIARKTRELLDGTGMTELYESGIIVDAEKGVRLYSVKDGLEHSYAQFDVQNNQISSIVSKTGINKLGKNETMYTRITQTESSIQSVAEKAVVNAQGIAEINRTAVIQNSDSIAAVAGKFVINGDNVTLVDGASLRVYKDGVLSTVGTVREINSAKSDITGTTFWQNRDSITQVAGKFTITSGGDVNLIDGASLRVYKDGVLSTVGTVSEINTVGSRVNAIEGSALWQNRSGITAVAGKFNVSGDNLNLVDGASLNVTRNGVEMAVADQGNIKSVINATTDSILIQADKINLTGYVTASELSVTNANITNLQTGKTKATKLTAGIIGTDSIVIGGYSGSWTKTTVVTRAEITLPSLTHSNSHYFMYGSSSSSQTPSGSVSGYLVTGWSAGSVTVSAADIYILTRGSEG